MKKILFLLVLILFQSCSQSNNRVNLVDFQIKLYQNYFLESDMLKQFIKDYVTQPENKGRKVFSLYIDQRMDTLLFTIWRIPRKEVKLENSFGYFYFHEKAIIIYSPFYKVFNIRRDTLDVHKISNLYKEELEYFKTHKQELVMWQLQIPYYDMDNFLILKNFYRIYNTTKPPIPDSVNVDFEYQAD